MVIKVMVTGPCRLLSVWVCLYICMYNVCVSAKNTAVCCLTARKSPKFIYRGPAHGDIFRLAAAMFEGSNVQWRLRKSAFRIAVQLRRQLYSKLFAYYIQLAMHNTSSNYNDDDELIENTFSWNFHALPVELALMVYKYCKDLWPWLLWPCAWNINAYSILM